MRRVVLSDVVEVWLSVPPRLLLSVFVISRDFLTNDVAAVLVVLLMLWSCCLLLAAFVSPRISGGSLENRIVDFLELEFSSRWEFVVVPPGLPLLSLLGGGLRTPFRDSTGPATD